MRALLCIGCNTYDHLPLLSKAEKDAKDLFEHLSPQGDYEKRVSRLLLSPAQIEIKDALSEVLPTGEEIDVLTFFFAGHAGVTAGSFYLWTRDTVPDRISMTAFPIISLFSVVNELRPRQLNIVIDGCQAGGCSFDVSQLLKPEVVGHSESSSITFLGACSANEYASETANGGVLTQYMMKCLTGERQIQNKSPSLDLLEISTEVCKEVLKAHPLQKPIAWGLSLFGNGYFARNPHYDASVEPNFPVNAILPQSEMGKRVRLQSAAIWDEYRNIKDDPSPRRLLDLLNSIFAGIT